MEAIFFGEVSRIPIRRRTAASRIAAVRRSSFFFIEKSFPIRVEMKGSKALYTLHFVQQRSTKIQKKQFCGLTNKKRFIKMLLFNQAMKKISNSSAPVRERPVGERPQAAGMNRLWSFV